jgi:NAD(P)-dependent dehydrogenase (short-subunit alcohol dehydrogenase family)
MFAEYGARVAIHYHANREAAERTRASMRGDRHLLVQADFAEPVSVRQAVEAVADEAGHIDVLVNNAGIFERHPIPESDFELWRSVWERTIDTNLSGSAHASFTVAKHMIRQGGGRIINITSRGAFRGEPSAPAYGASKAGLNAFSQSLAKALAPHRIYVYAVAPGWVETDMAAPYLSGEEGDAVRHQSPLGRVARPDEIARTVLFLASPGQEFLTGGIIDVNGASYLRT